MVVSNQDIEAELSSKRSMESATQCSRAREHTTIFILNEASWRGLQEASNGRVEKPADLFDYGARNIILTKELKGVKYSPRLDTD